MTKDKKILYIIQASGGLPKIYDYIKTKDYLLLSYKTKTKETTIYSPKSTWTTGRNELLAHIWKHNLRFDYYIFMDEDIKFKYISQRKGFKLFSDVLSQVDNPIVTGKAEGYFVENNLKTDMQTIFWFDPCFVAFSQKIIFDKKMFPYEEKYDSICWWASGQSFVYKANIYYYNQIIQCNQLGILNFQHSGYPRVVEFHKKVYANILAEFKINSIKWSELKEVKTGIIFPKHSCFYKFCYNYIYLSIFKAYTKIINKKKFLYLMLKKIYSWSSL